MLGGYIWSISNVTDLLKYVSVLGSTVFSEFTTADKRTLYLPGHSYTTLGQRAFANLYYTSNLYIGSKEDPCQWLSMLNNQLTSNSNLFDSIGTFLGSSTNVVIYLPEGTYTEEEKTDLLTALGLSHAQWGDQTE